MNNKKIPVVAIVGPTASGKTALSIHLAKIFDAEIVSADSMQIYKGMDIATAKPTSEEMQGIAHHLIGFSEISERFSVAEYVSLAKKTIFDINNRNKSVMLVGGTGLYVNSLIDNIEFQPEKENNLRDILNKEALEFGGDFLLEKLAKLDPEYAKKLCSRDIGRIIRGIEINTIFGHTMSQHMELSKQNESPFEPLIIGIAYKDRAALYDRINRRVDIMIENGLLAEAEEFYSKLDKDKTAIQAIGYKELFPYIKGEMSLDEAVDNLKKSTRNYAKRQITWFKKDQRVNWIYADEMPYDQLLKNAEKICNNFYNSLSL